MTPPRSDDPSAPNAQTAGHPRRPIAPRSSAAERGTRPREASSAQRPEHAGPPDSPEALEPPDPLAEVTAKIKRALIMAELERQEGESSDDPYNSRPAGSALDPWRR